MIKKAIIPIAGQGSRMLLRLLDEYFREGPLRERLVAAYVVGARVWEGPFERGEAAVPVCDGPEQTGCLFEDRSVVLKMLQDIHHNHRIGLNPLEFRPIA